MRAGRNVAACAVAAGLMSPALAAAASPAGPGVEIGARVGYGWSAGQLGAPANGTDSDVGTFVSGQLPLWLDVGYRFTDVLYLGGFFQYGFGTVNNDQQNYCRNANVDCSASDVRLGVMGRLQLPPISVAVPWLGLGIGYEWGSYAASQPALGSTDSSWSGFELANLQAGADFRIAQKVSLGPFFSVSFGQFQSTKTSTTPAGGATTSTDQDLTKKSLHEWIMIGARFAFMP